MPCISQFFGIMIYMYYRDHSPLHFHAVYNNDEAIIYIENNKILKGKLPKKVTSLVKKWSQLHKEELLFN